MRLDALGTHVLMELRECNSDALNDLPTVRDALVSTAEFIGATIVGHSFHQFSPQGVTGVVVIAESHLCIHTWPEHGYAAVDIFTCGDPRQLEEAVARIADTFQAGKHSIVSLKRGILEPSVAPISPDSGFVSVPSA